ncbi:transcriptional regulator [Streptococcus bovimastitidis]|uniref:Transcriptional regulator n=1 Tax=Streptococcus bovimastitidis TaxID=1856638 RepID=A0A1L8MP99_9STRE|nr:GntR family transcriptional regulator [Streptococcus bovimastitidis]OJF72495.1 transcriptional regulator [Streptococcus bovimastitidis]
MIQYEQIAEDIRRKILTENYKQDQKIPDQFHLSNEYQVSRMTIQKAINLLKIEGFLYSKRGKGTFVSFPALQQDKYGTDVGTIVGTSSYFSHQGKMSSYIISFEVRFPVPEEMTKLKIRADQAVYDIIRLRYLNDQPFHLEYSIYPIHIIKDLNQEVLDNSIYKYIIEDLGLEIGSGIRQIRADKPDQYDHDYLDCKENDPVLEIEQVVFLKDGRPFEYSQTRARYDKASVNYIDFR